LISIKDKYAIPHAMINVSPRIIFCVLLSFWLQSANAQSASQGIPDVDIPEMVKRLKEAREYIVRVEDDGSGAERSFQTGTEQRVRSKIERVTSAIARCQRRLPAFEGASG
jgi:hypothetical protein